MQAGTIISFIEPIHLLSDRQPEYEQQNQERAIERFTYLYRELTDAYADHGRWYTVRHAVDASLVL